MTEDVNNEVKPSEYYINSLGDFHFDDTKGLDRLYRQGAEIYLQESAFQAVIRVPDIDSKIFKNELELSIIDDSSEELVSYDFEKLLEDAISWNIENNPENDIYKLSFLRDKLNKFSNKLDKVIAEIKDK